LNLANNARKHEEKPDKTPADIPSAKVQKTPSPKSKLLMPLAKGMTKTPPKRTSKTPPKSMSKTPPKSMSKTPPKGSKTDVNTCALP
jgi:hypothetical protein